MAVAVLDDPDRRAEPQYVTKFDAIPGFWNYLIGLDRNDLIAELIQNDLDQGATLTVISFEQTRLICEGNGEPVDPEGWQRLRMIMGAGNEVPAKRSRFGVKNHGLKAAFTISDKLHLMSAGQSIVQTLYKKGRDSPPHPGASKYPMEDRLAPTEGCRVIVQYRDSGLKPAQGEAVKLDAVSADEIEALFKSACASMPEQFAGIVSPEVTPRYEVVLSHWKLGEAQFHFSCTKPRKVARRIEVFQRRCAVSGSYSALPEALRERAVRRLVPLKGVLKDRVADFFRRGRRFFVEASWPIDAKGKPRIGTGRYRYPLGYPLNSREARTGHSTHFNAPFASDNDRHAPARNEATNDELRKACNSLLIDALALYTLPRWRANGLKPIVPSAEGGDEPVRPLLAELAARGALPVLSWHQSAKLAVKRKRGTAKAVGHRAAARGSPKEQRRYRFVIPTPTWANNTINPLLSLLCPPSEKQLDPRVNADIVGLLTDGNTPGFPQDFVTFDENDVVDRITADGNQYFSGIAHPEHEFCEPVMARAYLDLIALVLDRGKLETEKEDSLASALLLPDVHGQATAFHDLYSSASLPSKIPGLSLPPILDVDLIAHALFKRRKWRLRKFTMGEFLESGTLQSADEQTRRLFWNWLRRSGRHIAPRDRPKLAALAVWPDDKGSLCKITDLCEPRSGRVGTVLAGFIQRPHEEVRRSKLVSIGGRARTSIRRTPAEEEIGTWFAARLTRFEIGSRPDSATAKELRRFERELSVLVKDRSVAPMLKAIATELPALARDGTIRPRTELVFPSRGNDRLALPDRFLLRDRQRDTLLAKLSPALKAPIAAMLLDAFAEDAGNFPALQARLKEFISIAEPDDDDRRELAGKPIIPVDGKPRAPSELAFVSNKGDYWGEWKTRISTEGLSQNDQSRYRAAGVTSALPKPETSRAFFWWLATQGQEVLRRHIPCVLRHFLHGDGPVRWASSFTDTPCIPVRGQNGLRLVSFRFVKRKSVFLSDGSIGEDLIQSDGTVLLAIDQAKEVATPISAPLYELGVKSLRETLNEPASAAGTGEVDAVSEEILARFHRLKSRRFRRTFRKRLNELGVDLGLVRRDWQDRLGRVQKILVGEDVEVRYRFRRKLYAQKAEAGFDPGTGVFWIKQGLGARRLYESVAEQLIFKPTARPIDLLALERALELEIVEPSFGQPDGAELDDDAEAEDNGGQGQATEGDGGLGEVKGGHHPFDPDPARNRPNPGPISNESTGRSRRPKERGGSQGLGEGENLRNTTDLEKKHIEKLKHDHYASHCQMCLCERPPLELAPVGSYIEWEEVRQSVVHAHHADLVKAGGARHAGNIVLLCKLHHDNYGKQFTRSSISIALRDNPKKMTVCYDEESRVDGKQIELTISGTGDTVKLFFTDDHIEFWLSQETVSAPTAHQTP